MVFIRIQHLNLIVYLPLDHDYDNLEAEYPKLRKAVDRRLSAIFREDKFGIITSSDVVVAEANGSTAQRLHLIENIIHRLRR